MVLRSLENGKLIPKENPNLYKTFSGEKNDMVGPGNYELEIKWNSTGTQWSKFKTNRIIDYSSSSDKIQKKIIDSLNKTHNNGFNNSNFEKKKMLILLNIYKTVLFIFKEEVMNI